MEREMTLTEIAERLRLAPRTLRQFLSRIRFEAIQGGRGTLLFTEDDYVKIREARRKCRSRSSRLAKVSPPTIESGALSPDDISTRLQRLRTVPLPKRR